MTTERWFNEGGTVYDENRLPVAQGVTERDAVLIAAAPELLAALRDIVPCLKMNGPHGLTAYFISDERMAAARAAIAAATDEG